MGAKGDNQTRVERADRELIISRTFNGPVHIVYAAWTKPELFMRWWAPKSMGVPMIACDMDVRTGGGYRIAFGHDAASAAEFFGKYIEVVSNERLVWTNEESGDASVTTVTFEEDGDKTHLVMRERYPNDEAAAASVGMEDGTSEQFTQLDELLVALKVGG